jgi:hypothetical protein
MGKKAAREKEAGRQYQSTASAITSICTYNVRVSLLHKMI